MPRPRTFEESEALQAAMLVFWRHGYEKTTYKMLERATGVGVRSLVNIFGDKDALFVRILQIYRANAEAMIAQVFNPPGVDAITTMFSVLSEQREGDDPANAGCLMVNTVFELSGASAPVRAEVDAYRSMWRDAFERALRADRVAQAEERAEFLLGVLWGALSQIRMAHTTQAAAPLARVAVDTVLEWRTA